MPNWLVLLGYACGGAFSGLICMWLLYPFVRQRAQLAEVSKFIRTTLTLLVLGCDIGGGVAFRFLGDDGRELWAAHLIGLLVGAVATIYYLDSRTGGIVDKVQKLPEDIRRVVMSVLNGRPLNSPADEKKLEEALDNIGSLDHSKDDQEIEGSNSDDEGSQDQRPEDPCSDNEDEPQDKP